MHEKTKLNLIKTFEKLKDLGLPLSKSSTGNGQYS